MKICGSNYICASTVEQPRVHTPVEPLLFQRDTSVTANSFICHLATSIVVESRANRSLGAPLPRIGTSNVLLAWHQTKQTGLPSCGYTYGINIDQGRRP